MTRHRDALAHVASVEALKFGDVVVLRHPTNPTEPWRVGKYLGVDPTGWRLDVEGPDGLSSWHPGYVIPQRKIPRSGLADGADGADDQRHDRGADD